MASLDGLIDGEQDRRVLDSLQRMRGVGHEQEITGTAFPGHLAGRQPDPAAKNLDGGQHQPRRLVEIITVGERFPTALRGIPRPLFLDPRSSLRSWRARRPPVSRRRAA
jgi:hypothetical protein